MNEKLLASSQYTTGVVDAFKRGFIERRRDNMACLRRNLATLNENRAVLVDVARFDSGPCPEIKHGAAAVMKMAALTLLRMMADMDEREDAINKRIEFTAEELAGLG